MSDVNANININIDSSAALQQLRMLQEQISNFNRSVIAGNAAAAQSQRELNRNLTSQINATRGFTTSIANVESSVSRLGRAIDKNKLSLGEYFKYGIASSGAFGKSMRQHAEIMELATDRVKRLQTQYIALGQAQNGYTKSLAVRPAQLFNAETAVAIQRQQIFHKLLGDGSTALVNWGKNTQWAGRQLMVGFTVPLTIFGGMAGKIFMDLEKQVVQFKRVYGDLATPVSERNAMVEEVKSLAKEFTKYGIAVSDTVALAAKAAATGAQGADLLAQTTEATRLATLGQIDYQQALDATISLQTAFGISSKDLGEATNFLNAVENQTVTSLDDITQAIPLVAPVVRGLGGDVRDLAIFMTAMREGGISANEGANALKSGLASLINPTKAAREQLSKVGIDIDTILSKNKGDLRGLVSEFGVALSSLDKFTRQQTLAKMFGKYQFARMGALFQNIAKDGSQASRVMDLTAMSAKELGQIAEGELGQLEEAVSVKFTGAVEKLKLAIAPIGEAFLKIATPIIEFATKVAEKFNDLPDMAKTFITWGTAIGGVLVPTIIMLVGLLGNFSGNLLKIGIAFARLTGKSRGLGSVFNYLEGEQLDAMAASASLEGKTETLTSALRVQRGAVISLAKSYSTYIAAADAAAMNLPQGFRTPARRMATGGLVPGVGNKDTVPALLTPGESVINKDATKKFGPLLSAINSGSVQKFARGQVNIGSGDTPQFLTLDMRSAASTSAAIETLLGFAEEAGRDIKDAFVNILRTVQETQQEAIRTGQKVKTVTLKEIKKMVIGSGDPALSRALYTGQGKEGVRYNASSAGIKGTVEQGIRSNPLMSAQEAEAEIQRLDAAKIGAQRSINAYYDTLLEEVSLDEQGRAKLIAARDAALRDAGQGVRAHTAQISNFQKMFAEAWSPELWMPQTGSENQLSNILAQSDSTREAYEKHLREIVTDTSEADRIMAKITANLALTEEELAVQSHVLKAMTQSSSSMAAATPGFAGAAIGTIGAAEARAAMPGGFFTLDTAEIRAQAQQAAIVAKDEAIAAWRAAWRINSPSEMAADSSDEIPKGVAVGIERSTPVATTAAREMAAEVGIATESGLAGIAAKLAAQPTFLGPVGPTSSLDPKKRALENVPTGRGKSSVPIAQVSNQEILESTGRTVKDNEKETKKLKERTHAFSGKIFGGMMAMDGLVLGLSMMNNSVGEFAQKILPATFAVQGLTMMLPMISNPIGGTIAALVAVAAGLWFLNSQVTDLKDQGKRLSDAMYGSTKGLKEMADFFGKKTWKDKLGINAVNATGAEVTNENTTQAKEFLSSDPGQGLMDNVKLAQSYYGKSGAIKSLQNQLQRMLLEGIVNPQTASAIAAELGTQLGDYDIGVQATAHINSVIGPDGTNLKNLNGRLKVVADIVGDTTDLNDAFARAGMQWDGASWWTQATMVVKGEGTADLFAVNAVQDTIDKLAVYQTEIDRLRLLFDQGKISAEEYSNRVGMIFDQSKVVSWANTVKEAQRLFGDEFAQGADAFNEMAQKMIDSMDDKAWQALGEEKFNAFKEGFVKDYGGIAVDLRNAGQVASRVTTFKNDGEIELANQLLADQQRVMDFTIAMNSPNFPMDALIKMVNDGTVGFDLIADLTVKYDDPQAQALASIAAGIVNPDSHLNMLITTAIDKGNLGYAEKWVNYALEGKRLGLNMDLIMTQNDVKELRATVDDINAFNALPSPITKSAAAKFWSEGYELTDAQMKAFMALPDGQKRTFYSIYRTIIMEPEKGNAKGRELLGPNPTVGPTLISDKDYDTAGNNWQLEESLGMHKKAKPPKLDPKPAGGSGGGGGEKEKTWLEQRIEEMKSNAKLYETAAKWADDLNKKRGFFFGRIQQMRTGKRVVKGGKVVGGYAQMPEQLIEEIGAGPEGLKRLQELLGLSKRAFNNFIKRWKEETLGKTMDMMKSEVKTKQRANKARNILSGSVPGLSENQKKQFKFSNDELDKLMDNPEWVESFHEAMSKSKKYQNDFLTWTRKWMNSLKEEVQDNTLDDAISLIDQSFSILEENINAQYDANIKPLQKQIDANEQIIDSFQKQIDAKQELIDDQEHLNDLDQQAIDNYNRDIDMQQRKIDAIKREDDIRQRTAEALQRELDLLSRAEEEIRTAYQKRIDALDEVAKLNDRIVQSQQDQLDIAEALSQGDIYAAAKAAEAMQANSIDYARELNRTSLEKGMENEVNNLRTSSGLTRAQAEQQIQQIQDQSYQVSLQIREIEDYIYNLKQTKILPLEDAIYNRNLSIRDLQNEIYDINENSIEPLEIKNKDLQEQIASQERLRDLALEEMVIGEFTKDAWEQRKRELNMATVEAELNALALNKIADKYRDIAAAARAAAAEIAKVPGASPTTAPTGSATNTSSTSAGTAGATSSGGYYIDVMGVGQVWVPKATGGMIRKYAAAGSVLGDGARDTVPALLTPGEFVVRKSMVDKYGKSMLSDINNGSFRMPTFSLPAQASQRAVQATQNVNSINAPVYNSYSINVNASTNATPDEIAQKVMTKIKNVESTSIRRVNGY